MNWYSPSNLEIARQAHVEAMRTATNERLLHDEERPEGPERSRLGHVFERLLHRRTLKRPALGAA